MKDDDNADELGESGGMKSQTTTKKAFDTGCFGAYD